MLSLEKLTLGYNGHVVVQDFDLSIPDKRIVGLIGPNGSGKTTILRALAGLIEPVRGKVLFQSVPIFNMDKRSRARQIGFVPQREITTWPLTVYEAVRLGRAAHRGWLLPYTAADKSIIEYSIARTELSSLKDRPVNKLSGGEFQRVLIARVLAQEPQILLLDEPTANLDVHHQVQVLDLVQDLMQERGLSVVMAIHDLTLAARFCDRLVLLDRGRKVRSGTPEEVLIPETIQAVFGVEARLYRDPWGGWAVSVRQNGKGKK